MTSELERLHRLNDRLQLVPKGATVDELELNASAFTHEAAKLLHAEGWRRIRKTEGKHVAGLDIDKLVNLHTTQCVDIVVNAGAPNATVAFNDAGTFTDFSRMVEVRPDGSAPAFIGGSTPAPPAGDEFEREVMMQLVNERAETNVLLDRIVTALEAIGERLHDINDHFGVIRK